MIWRRISSFLQLRNLRKRHRKIRARLQSRGTKSAKRLLKKRSLKERRFATIQNHTISKQLVETAQRTNQAIVLEDLTGIRLRSRVNRKVRTELHNWSFAQLRAFIEYKAKLAGVRVITVDPKYTSQTCSQCSHRAQSNRRSQSKFQCRVCGNADINAASNIAVRGRAAVNQPHTGVAVSPQLLESRLL